MLISRSQTVDRKSSANNSYLDGYTINDRGLSLDLSIYIFMRTMSIIAHLLRAFHTRTFAFIQIFKREESWAGERQEGSAYG